LDVLSEVLTAIRMDGAVYINAEFTAPWCAEAQHGLQAQRPGARSLLAKLSELSFIEVFRLYIQSQPLDQKGWLAGLRDPYIGRALALLHGKPRHRWTVDEPADVELCLRLGVDAIITNRPAEVIAQVRDAGITRSAQVADHGRRASGR
jgi:hypothetical protein